MREEKRRIVFRRGMRDGIPIALGYFAVSFALGIAAKNYGLDALQAGIMSFGMLASAGEFAAIGLIAHAAGFVELVVTTIIINLRYCLMSCSLSQKIDKNMPFVHRFLLSYMVTDELFGISMAVEGPLNPYYTYGAALLSAFGWTIGTVLGVLVGNILPDFLVNALAVALYGMFLAIIIPPAKKEKKIAILVVVSMLTSYVFHKIPFFSKISSGFSIIILTIVLAGIAAVLWPREEEKA